MLDAARLFHGLPTGLRDPLIAEYGKIARNYAEHRWEPAELNGGKLCEVVYSIVDGATSGTYPTSPQKPPRMVDACRAMEQRQANPALPGDRSLRVLIPRLLPFLYEIRNNRGVGHVGGDVSPNYSDATAVFSCSNWILAELIRVFHGVSLDEAQTAIDALVERKHPIVWEIERTKRVLDPQIQRADQVLVLLYSSNGWVEEGNLRSWAEYKNTTNFRDLVLWPLHKDRLLEYDAPKYRARITPRGSKDVEDRILLNYKS
jgi:hypothetical protein